MQKGISGTTKNKIQKKRKGKLATQSAFFRLNPSLLEGFPDPHRVLRSGSECHCPSGDEMAEWSRSV